MTSKEPPQKKLESVRLAREGAVMEVVADGAYVTDFSVSGNLVLMPYQTFDTPKGPKRRGGIPLLFPNAGPITLESAEFNLDRHGFARNLPWKIEDVGAISTRLFLESNTETEKSYPFKFSARLGLGLGPSDLTYSLTVNNLSDKILPNALGIHGYYYVPLEKRAGIKTNIDGFDPKNYDWKSSIFLKNSGLVTLEVPEMGVTTITSSPNLKTLVIWSEPNRPHLCLEPWVGPVNAILDPNQRAEIRPGGSENFWMKISYQKFN